MARCREKTPGVIIGIFYHIMVLFEGVVTTYTEPTDYRDECHCEECEKRRKTEGVAELLSGERLSLEPANLDRKTRNLLAKG